MWSPTADIPESKCKYLPIGGFTHRSWSIELKCPIPLISVEEYISVAKEKYGYNGEQALGMLFWHKHDLERAVLDLANFTPFPDEWTVEDKVLFEQAFQFHGKSFHRIRQMVSVHLIVVIWLCIWFGVSFKQQQQLPDKPIPSLVKYYYSWKKTRSRTSVMDRQEKIKAKEGSENGSENGSNEESDTEEKVRFTPLRHECINFGAVGWFGFRFVFFSSFLFFFLICVLQTMFWVL